MRGFYGKVRRFIPHLRFFFFQSGDQFANTNSTFMTRISPQWLSELRWLWTSIPWRVACKFVFLMDSHTMMPMLGEHNQPIPTWLKGLYVFSCNLPSALLEEWLRPFMSSCGNSGGGMDTEIKVSTRLSDYESGALPPSFTPAPRMLVMTVAANSMHLNFHVCGNQIPTHFRSLQFRKWWYLGARESPFTIYPVSQICPQVLPLKHFRC